MSTVVQFPRNAGIGVGILAAGALIYPLWRSGAQGDLGRKIRPT
jgi:hypothetical protein